MNGIIGKNWRPGSYDRTCFSGDLMQFKYTHRGIRIARNEVAALYEDEEAERLTAAGRIPKDRYQAYIMEGCRYFFVCPELLQGTNEEVYGSAVSLRNRHFGPKLFSEAYRMPHKTHRIDGIDQSDFLRKMSGRPVRLFYLSEAEFTEDFKEDLQEALLSGKKVFILVSEREDGVLPTGELLREILGDSRPVVIPVPDLSGSMNYSKVPVPAELEKAISDGEAILLGYGEDALMSARNLALPAFVKTCPHGLYTRAVTGLFSLERTSLVYVPAGFDILPYVPVIRRTELHYNLLAALSRKYGEEIYRMLQPESLGEGVYSGPRAVMTRSDGREEMLARLRKWEPELFFNIYDDHVPPIPAGGFQWTSGSFEKAREQFLTEKLRAIPGIRCLHACFRKNDSGKPLLDPAPAEIDWEAETTARQLIVDGIVADPSLDIEFRIEGTGQRSPREEAMAHPENGTAILSNFAFFFTEKLRTLYNLHRMKRPGEIQKAPSGYVDYYRFTDSERKRHESFPLYRKLCLGRKEDGSFRVFPFELRGGCVTLSRKNGEQFSIPFTKEEVNPQTPGETAVFTPLISEGDMADFLGYEKEVGAGRLNLILIGETLCAAVDGGVLQPPHGVVLSLSGSRRESLRSLFPDLSGTALSIRLDPPEGFSTEEWDAFREVFGGGLGLLYNGMEMNEANSLELLSEQGWTCPLSAQTQESNLVSRMRHPRTATGVTRDGRLVILVFSGRSKVSEGADYLEMLEAARLLVPDLQALINWDGGGSSVLGLLEGEAFTEINLCAPSDDSLAGMVRPISSEILVRIPS